MQEPVERIEDVIGRDMREQEADHRGGKITMLTCPDCGGSLWQVNEQGLRSFVCHTGHRWSTDTLVLQKTEQLEAALFEAYRLLKEKVIMLRQTAKRARAEGHADSAARLEEQAMVDERHCEVLKTELLEKEPSSLSNKEIEDDLAGRK